MKATKIIQCKCNGINIEHFQVILEMIQMKNHFADNILYQKKSWPNSVQTIRLYKSYKMAKLTEIAATHLTHYSDLILGLKIRAGRFISFVVSVRLHRNSFVVR